FYLDKDGNGIEEEPDGPGRTGLIVEDNKLAEGVLIYSDDTETQHDRVAFVYGDSIVSMFFKKKANFPYYMTIKDGGDIYSAFLSSYDKTNHIYNVTFVDNGSYEPMSNVVLNENIFTLYEKDDELTPSQNRRMENMTIAMGVWGSLYATFEQLNSFNGIPFSRGLFSSFFRGVAKVFSYIAVAAAVVANVVAPIVSFINPAAGMAIAAVATAVGEACTQIAAGLLVIAAVIELIEGGSPTIQEGVLPVVYVTLPNEKNRSIKFNENGIHEEFHIPKGKDLLVQFYIPRADLSKITTEILNKQPMVFLDEPSSKGGKLGNDFYFTQPPTEVVPSTEPEKLLVKIKRDDDDEQGHIGDGKINFGFVFNFYNKGDEKPLDLEVNGYKGGFDFRMPALFEKQRYKNMVVIYFCVVKNCPDIKQP
ncbi:MAG: hypothetical protein LBU85_07440, partial [Treponema sp.]|nr:hypothetical protein [Treponema sp.]